MIKKLGGAIIIIMCLALGTNIYAITMDELEKEKEDIEKAWEEAEIGLENSKEEWKEVNNKIKELELNVLDVKYKIEGLENNLADKRTEISDIRLELIAIKQEQEVLYGQAKQRIKVMYEYGDLGYLDVLFDSSDITDFLNRLEYINQLLEFDHELFKGLNQIEEDILAQEIELEVQEASLAHLTVEATLEKEQLEIDVLTKTTEIESILEDQELYEVLMDGFKEAEEAIDENIKELIRQSELVYSGGEMEWPVPGWYRLSSPFGPRLHPIHKTWRDHNGVDIPASSGTPIIAAAKGKIIIAQYSSSYGNYIIIDHGSGYATIYAHASKLLVSAGDTVVRGETIAEVGTTGWSTGNHLHFGVQIDNVWVDPMEYVK